MMVLLDSKHREISDHLIVDKPSALLGEAFARRKKL
jgi:hypothetical protein